jgi:hypothetical protein
MKSSSLILSLPLLPCRVPFRSILGTWHHTHHLAQVSSQSSFVKVARGWQLEALFIPATSMY